MNRTARATITISASAIASITVPREISERLLRVPWMRSASTSRLTYRPKKPCSFPRARRVADKCMHRWIFQTRLRARYKSLVNYASSNMADHSLLHTQTYSGATHGSGELPGVLRSWKHCAVTSRFNLRWSNPKDLFCSQGEFRLDRGDGIWLNPRVHHARSPIMGAVGSVSTVVQSSSPFTVLPAEHLIPKT
jgi:hypothetical protein